MRDLEGIELID